MSVGGRTAWSAAVVIGEDRLNARFWYGGEFVWKAKEDAAQVALMHYRAIPRQGSHPIPIYNVDGRQTAAHMPNGEIIPWR